MATVTTIPVNIAVDAAEHARKLGQQREFEMMLDKLKEIIPELRAIDVSRHFVRLPFYDDDPIILFSTYQPNYTGPGLDPTNEAWIQWSFPGRCRTPRSWFIASIHKAFP